MIIVGANAGRAAPPRQDPDRRRALSDGSAALLADGKIICATVEERHTRQRYAGGFSRSLRSCLREARKTLDQIDAFGISTCCDSRWRSETDRIDAILEELAPDERTGLRTRLRGRTFLVDHHDSHAALAFVGSGFPRSLVFVIDGFGNRNDGQGGFVLGPDWWTGRFDRQTAYLAEWRDGYVFMERVSEAAPADIGVGEFYRSVTHFLGWPSYQFAGKTMALASYGDAGRLAGLSLVAEKRAQPPSVLLGNQHDDPVGQISAVLARAGLTAPAERPASPDVSFLADLAAVAQRQLERGLAAWICGLCEDLGLHEVALGGGVALNCVAVGKLASENPHLRIYVPPAPGDTGQGLGNALWLARMAASPVASPATPRRLRTAALGPRPDARRIARLASVANDARKFRARRLAQGDLAAAAVDTLTAGKLIGVRRGRSEYGPRALGQTSLLYDPSRADAQKHVNLVKRRERFRPFAATVRAEAVADWFAFDGESPFMSFAVPGRERLRRGAPGIVHVDGTTRIQTLTKASGFFDRVVSTFERQTGIPLLLNTSFNLSGEPMVETPEDAFDAFSRSSIEALILGDYFVERL